MALEAGDAEGRDAVGCCLARVCAPVEQQTDDGLVAPEAGEESRIGVLPLHIYILSTFLNHSLIPPPISSPQHAPWSNPCGAQLASLGHGPSTWLDPSALAPCVYQVKNVGVRRPAPDGDAEPVAEAAGLLVLVAAGEEDSVARGEVPHRALHLVEEVEVILVDLQDV